MIAEKIQKNTYKFDTIIDDFENNTIRREEYR